MKTLRAKATTKVLRILGLPQASRWRVARKNVLAVVWPLISIVNAEIGVSLMIEFVAIPGGRWRALPRGRRFPIPSICRTAGGVAAERTVQTVNIAISAVSTLDIRWSVADRIFTEAPMCAKTPTSSSPVVGGGMSASCRTSSGTSCTSHVQRPGSHQARVAMRKV